jgi:hypothetical protein
MKRGTPEHPKLHNLAAAIHEKLHGQKIKLQASTCLTLAIGIFERLIHFAARYAVAGDIGKHDDQSIARALGWENDPAWLIDTLARCKLLDASDSCRWFLHGWPEHSDDTADRYLADHQLNYADGNTPRNKPRMSGKRSRAKRRSSGGKDDAETERRDNAGQRGTIPANAEQRGTLPAYQSQNQSQCLNHSQNQGQTQNQRQRRTLKADSGLTLKEQIAKLSGYAAELARKIPPTDKPGVRLWGRIGAAVGRSISENAFYFSIDQTMKHECKNRPGYFRSTLDNKLRDDTDRGLDDTLAVIIPKAATPNDRSSNDAATLQDEFQAIRKNMLKKAE